VEAVMSLLLDTRLASAATIVAAVDQVQYVESVDLFSEGTSAVAIVSAPNPALLEASRQALLQVTGILSVEQQTVAPSPPQVIGRHANTVNAVAWSPDGRQLVSGDEDGKVRFWDVIRGNELDSRSLSLPQGVSSLAWSPDGTQLAIGSWDGKVRLQQVGGNSAAAELGDNLAIVRYVAWLPDGTQVVSASADHTARVWDVAQPNTVVLELQGHTGEVFSAAWNATGTRIVTAGADGAVRVWQAR
jgi:WD40 repeat protein